MPLTSRIKNKFSALKNRGSLRGNIQSGVDDTSPSGKILTRQDLWPRAYEVLQQREPDLVADYKRHLKTPKSNSTSDTNLLDSGFAASTVQQLLENRDKKQWHISLLGKDVKIRAMAETLTKILLWSDDIVKDAVSSQPYAALAWSAISMLLPVSDCLFD